MKIYHPVEYMSAVLTFEMGSTDKVVEYIEECRRMTLLDGSKGIRVLPPDVNVSDKDFTPVYTDDVFSVGPRGRASSGSKGRKAKPKVEGVIRFGLAAVRGVGEKAVETIVKIRHEKGEFANLYDFCERIDLRQVSRSTIEALIKCGAFSSTKARRSQLLQILDRAVEMGQQMQSDLRSGQMSMFGGGGPATPSLSQTMGSTLPDIEEVDNAQLLKFEKELLGFYITSHPLTEQQTVIERYTTASTRDVLGMAEGTEVTVGGMISRVKKVVTRNGRSAGMQMAIITMEDLDGQIDGTMFAETFAEVSAKYPTAIANESIVFVKGKVDRKRETPSLLVNEVIPASEAVARLTTAIAVKLDPAKHNAPVIEQIPPVLGRHKGTMPVYFQVNTPTGKVTMQIDRQHAVKLSPQLVGDLEQLLGPGSVDLAGAGSKRKKRLEQQRLFKEDAEETIDVSTAGAVAEMDLEMETEEQANA
jgi:DNA polymerase III subunit alpha